MATALPAGAVLSTGTTVIKQSGVIWSRTMSGGLFGRDMYSQPRFSIKAVFSVLTEEDAEVLEDFLQAYRTQLLIITIRQYTYNAYVAGDVERAYLGGNGLVSVTVPMDGVRV